MVPQRRLRDRSQRRLRPPWLRVQHSMSSLQRHRCGHQRLRPCSRPASRHIGGDAEPGGESGEFGPLPAADKGYYHQFAARVEEEAAAATAKKSRETGWPTAEAGQCGEYTERGDATDAAVGGCSWANGEQQVLSAKAREWRFGHARFTS
jgi:hypothetical protein